MHFGGGEIDKLILKCIWKCNGTWIAKTILKMNRKMGGLTLPDIKLFQGCRIKTVWYWHEDRTIESRNKALNLWSTDFWQECWLFTAKRVSLFNKRCCDNWIFTWRRKLDSYLTLQTTINLIRYLKVLGKNTTLLEENTLGSLYNFGLCNEFSVMTPKTSGKRK